MALILKPVTAACAAAIWLAACAPAPEAGGQEADTAAPGLSDETLYAIEGEEAGNEELVSYSVPPEELIAADRIGLARAGASLAELQAELGAAPVRFVQSFMVDFSAVCVEDSAGAELYCAVIEQTTAPAADAKVLMVMTRHPRFRTREGVGPGVAIADAALVFGDAFLSYSDDNEGREYVEFDRGPAGSIRFRTLLPSNEAAKAGLYEAGPGPFHETPDYDPEALIGAVEVHASARE